MAKTTKLKDGDTCSVIAGTHTGKSGTVSDINTSKTGHITITVTQENGVRFKTLGKNVVVETASSTKRSPAKKTAAAKPAVRKKPAIIHKDIKTYNTKQAAGDIQICDLLSEEITRNLPGAENKIWHAHPVWFLDGNPVAGYSKLKDGIRLMFWSGMSFDEPALKAGSGKFKDASFTYTSVDDVNVKDLKRWLKKSRDIQWDYKNIVKRKGKLERLK